MKLRFGRCALVLSMAAVVSLVCLHVQVSARSPAARSPEQRGAPDVPQSQSRSQDDGVRLPNGKLQRDEILKAEHEQNLKEAGEIRGGVPHQTKKKRRKKKNKNNKK